MSAPVWKPRAYTLVIDVVRFDKRRDYADGRVEFTAWCSLLLACGHRVERKGGKAPGSVLCKACDEAAL